MRVRLESALQTACYSENMMHITGIGYDNQPWLLVEKESQRLVQRGEILKDFRGETLRIVGGSAPHKPSSTGRIRTGEDQTFYPSVVGCVWIKV